MGWLKSLKEGFEEASAALPIGKTSASENLVSQYCRQRYNVESCREKGGEVDAFELKKYEALRKRVERSGVDFEKRYRKFKAERRSLPEEEREALVVAEDMFQGSDTTETKTGFKTPKQDEEFTDEREQQHISPDGRAVSVKMTNMVVAACGKRLSSKDEIAGFCAVCRKAECAEHIRHCAGYDKTPCGKPLCIKHTHYFTDEDGTEQPCCAEHYNMRLYFQKNFPDSDSEPRKKSKKSEKESE